MIAPARPAGQSADPSDAAFRDDLDATLARAWALLARGAADRRSGFHTVQLATLAADGPRVRTVVLRGVEAAAARVRLHTDARSTKLADLAAEPRVEICAYDPRTKIQLRLRGVAQIHRADVLADAAWAATGPNSRICYRAAHAPGAPIPAPDAADPPAVARSPAFPDVGREHFAAIVVTLARLEWLYLAASGHRRAAFDRAGEAWTGGWLAP